MGQSLEERLRRLEDILAIQQLFIDYGLALDAGDLDRYAQLFAIQGTVNLGPIGRATGRSEIQALMAQTLEGLVGSSFHIVSSPQINLHGDIATSQVMWTVIHRDKNGQPQVTMIGKHHDELIRENGEWKIQTRKGTVDIPSKYQAPKI
jgi:ketosteroid isomerase-like protein